MRAFCASLMLVAGAAVVALPSQAKASGYGCAPFYSQCDPYTHANTFQYVGGPRYQTVSHVRYFDQRTFRHHVFENVVDQRVFHTGEYRRTRITGHIYTPSYRAARQMYRSRH